MTNFKRKVAIGSTALAAAAFAGGAYAATQEPSAGTRQAFMSDIAKRLHVSPAQLNAALQGALDDQLQAAVSAGKLTQAQANAIRRRMSTGSPPLPLGRFWFSVPPGGQPHSLRGTGRLSAAAKYLGVSETQVFAQLAGGKTLAQIATARHKSVAGLADAMTAAIRAQLDKAVADKLITSAQEQMMLSRLPQRITNEINGRGTRPGRMHPMFHGWTPRSAPTIRPGAFAPPAPGGPAY